jgi:hypothetical protein
MAVRDWSGWQGGIGYREYRSPRELYEFLRRIGVTHVVWPGVVYAHESLASELRFLSFATHYTEEIRTFGSHRLGTLPKAPPVNPSAEPVLYLGCNGYTPGVYELDDLQVVSKAPPADTRYPPPREPLRGHTHSDIEPLITRALFVIRNTHCTPNTDVHPSHHGFIHVKNRAAEEVWIRQRP